MDTVEGQCAKSKHRDHATGLDVTHLSTGFQSRLMFLELIARFLMVRISKKRKNWMKPC